MNWLEGGSTDKLSLTLTPPHDAFNESSLFLRMNAQFVPRRFREVHVVVACSFLDVGEGQSAICIGNVNDLIESRDRITDMLCVGQWLFTLLRKCVDAVGQVALRRQPSMFLVRFPCCFRHVSTILSLNTWLEGERSVYSTLHLASIMLIVFFRTAERCGRAHLFKRPSTESAAMERLRLMCCAESIGPWYRRYLCIGPRGMKCARVHFHVAIAHRSGDRAGL